jgi:predicted DNA-binding ribbon-helix-helix protein
MTSGIADASLRVTKRSLTVAGHSTSVSLEEPFWQALRQLAAREAMSLPELVADIDTRRGGANLSSAIRVHVLRAALDGSLTPS